MNRARVELSVARHSEVGRFVARNITWSDADNATTIVENAANSIASPLGLTPSRMNVDAVLISDI